MVPPGIIAYSFEAGAERFSVNPDTGAITRRSVELPAVLRRPGHAGQHGRELRHRRQPDPLMVNEGHDSTMEFADGNYGLLQGALEYSRDTTAPNVDLEYSAARDDRRPDQLPVQLGQRAAVIHYTTDGSTRRRTRPTYESQGARRPGQVLTISRSAP